MRQLLVSVFLVSVCNIGFGQKFTLRELIILNNMDWNEFDSYVVNKGYDYNRTENLEYVDSKSYGYRQKGEESSYFVSKTVAKNKEIRLVAFQTTNKQDYLSIKYQLKNGGFSFIKTEAKQQTMLLVYKKGSMIATLAISKAERNINETFNVYEISIRSD